ncbi:hypothetical protein BABINDRAFT_161642 [Babjeviella inositovora NRRL Y-12698]|uniref:DNA-directed RNA polymerase III subunit RPC4 n=1 Tax=Babjeviella inositovora NRRL Y-12698 TaxID=984486 RepID=A0A1E3QSJ7_9ASCO|nr:uncharacterized protein BABINDRAFT_161642 [Babjeviella inositovora NRRL Y-12698]ODQ79992.1 hypothetical protein BABINDRAFT_161642 [Babjeviella inositovora NRRL Y-12698]
MSAPLKDVKPPVARLDSLARRTPAATPAARGGLKFKPKTVARRTKEERDADAPVMVEAKPVRATRGGIRGRGRGRGGRGGMTGTHMVSTGPLASGDAFSARATPSRTCSSSPTPDYIAGLKLKTERISHGEDDDEDPNDPKRIDMSKEYRFDDNETVLFPVRALRDEASPEPEEEVKLEVEDVRSLSPESDDKPIKGRPLDDMVDKLHDTEDKRVVSDHARLTALIKALDLGDVAMETDEAKPTSRKFILFQLPKQLPLFEMVAKEKEEDVVEVEAKSEADVKPEAALEGQVGKLRFHKSGKITMKVGNVVMDVDRGAKANFLQDVVLVNRNSSESRAYSLGHIDEKVIVTPRFY